MGSDPVLQGNRGYRYQAQSPSNEPDLSLQLFTALGFATLCALHFLLTYLDFAILSPLEILWNVLVYLTPVRLISLLARLTHTKSAEMELSGAQSTSQGHALKSDALRKLLRLYPASSKKREDGLEIMGAGLGPPKARVQEPPGLGNWDNSCYQNSVLQSLASMPSVLDFLDSTIASLPTAETTTGTLHSLTHSLTDKSNNGRQMWTPPKLKSMSSWQQQDAQEYYSRILGDVEKELKMSVMQGTRVDSGLQGFGRATDSIANKDLDTVHTPSRAPQIPLEGLLGQRVACVTCGHTEGLSLLPFNCLTVSPGTRQSYNLEDLLDDYTSLESIEGVECMSCTFNRHAARLEGLISQDSTSPGDQQSSGDSKKSLPPLVQQQIITRLQAVHEAIADRDFSDRVAAQCSITKDARVSSTKTKQVVIARPPRSLAIHVNRSIFDELTGAMAKNLAYVAFPKAFSLSPWTLGQDGLEHPDKLEEWPTSPTASLAPRSAVKSRSTELQYELKAVVSHFGRHENGHYICYRQHKNSLDRDQGKDDGTAHDEQWWRLSDDTVTPATEDEVMHQGGVFMLFYERVAVVDRPHADILENEPQPDQVDPAGDGSQTADTILTEPVTPGPADTVDVELESRAGTQPVVPEQVAAPDVQQKLEGPKVDLPQIIPKPELDKRTPQTLRTSRLGADPADTHLTASRSFVAAQ